VTFVLSHQDNHLINYLQLFFTPLHLIEHYEVIEHLVLLFSVQFIIDLPTFHKLFAWKFSIKDMLVMCPF